MACIIAARSLKSLLMAILGNDWFWLTVAKWCLERRLISLGVIIAWIKEFGIGRMININSVFLCSLIRVNNHQLTQGTGTDDCCHPHVQMEMSEMNMFAIWWYWVTNHEFACLILAVVQSDQMCYCLILFHFFSS